MTLICRTLAMLIAMAAVALPAHAEEASCHIGDYALPGGRWILLAGADKALGYTRSDGAVGQLVESGPGRFEQAAPREPLRLEFAECGAGVVMVTEGEAPPVVGRQVRYPEKVVTIAGDGVTLAAKLVQPAKGRADTVVVWVTGSDQTGDVDHVRWQYLLPRQGVAVLVLDKRGTGGSTGAQTANFDLRAADVAAAVRETRALMGPKARVGLFGVSQGGWVAPLAASRTPVDFVIVGYGMAEGVTAEDREEIVQNLEAAGYGPDVIAKAMEIQAATTRIAVSHWANGWEELDALKVKYKDAPWIPAMGQEGYTGMMIAMPSALGRVMGPKSDFGISFGYDPEPVIAALKTPQLWILGGKDMGAPSQRTQAILTRLQGPNPGIDLVVFPEADHGILERTETAGVRYVRIADGYAGLVAAWARTGRIPPLPANVLVHPGSDRLSRFPRRP